MCVALMPAMELKMESVSSEIQHPEELVVQPVVEEEPVLPPVVEEVIEDEIEEIEETEEVDEQPVETKKIRIGTGYKKLERK